MKIDRKKKVRKASCVILAAALWFTGSSFAGKPVYADAAAYETVDLSEGTEPEDGGTVDTKKNIKSTAVTCKDNKSLLLVYGSKGKVKWAVNNKKVVKIVSTNKNKCEIMPLKVGKTTVVAKSDNVTARIKVVVKPKKAFLDAWCKQWVKDYIKDDMNFEEKLIMASIYVVAGFFQYGNTSEPEDVVLKGMGTCVSGSRLLAQMCHAMGFPDAKARFAADDDFPIPGVIFMEQHYNVEVKVGGEKYYIDGTPGGKAIYLCTKNKTLYLRYVLNGQILTPEEFMDVEICP